MRPAPRHVISFVLAAIGASACTRNPYVIGTVCPPAGADAGVVDPRCAVTAPKGTLVVGLDHSGAAALGPLPLASGAVEPALRLRGERATATAWPTDAGPALGLGAGVPVPGLGAPFNDGMTGAVGLPADASAYVAPDAALGAVGMDDFALEVVLRAATGASLLDKRAGAVGWALREDAGGQLLLELGDGVAGHAVAIASPALTPGAWYHCLFWVSRAAGGRVDCDGREGTPVALPALASLDVPTALLAAGGGAAARVAHVELFRVDRGGLGDATTWTDISRLRFATLTGVNPTVAKGTPLPLPGLRKGDANRGEAYLDLQSGAGAPRRLYLVGIDWPRVACRTDVSGAFFCGYLADPARTRVVPSAAAAWQAAGVTVGASATPFADGEPRFAALAAAATAGAHTLSFAANAGAHQVFSFFVRGVTAARVGASAGASGTAVFDLLAGSVVSAPAGIDATIEPWGNGIFRCAYVVNNAVPGPLTYAVQMLDDAGNATFTGTGATSLEVAGLQVDVGLGYAGSLLAMDIQPADRLTYVADDGNLPQGTEVTARLSMLLPPGKPVNDQAILNINRGGTFVDQVQLYLRGDNSHLKFWALNGAATPWAFDADASVVDGARHAVRASWDGASARLVIDDGTPKAMPLASAEPTGLDRLEVGFSENSSGALEGLVAGLSIGAM